MKNPLAVVSVTMFLVLSSNAGTAEEPAGIVAHYMFNEGSGDVLHDRSGNGHEGRIVGAQWAQQDVRARLQFRDDGSYVDFGNDRDLKLAGDATFLIWARLDASPYPNDRTNWTLIDCESYPKEGFIIRVDGGSSRVMYRAGQVGGNQYSFSVRALENHEVHFVAVVRRGDTATIYVNGIRDTECAVKPPDIGAAPFRIGAAGQSFSGAMLDIAIVNRALDSNDIAARFWLDAARYGRSNAQQGQLSLTPFIYYGEKEARADVDFFGVMPLAPDEHVAVELARRDGEPVATKDVAAIPAEGRAEYVFALDGLADGAYELRAVLKSAARTTRASVAFEYPAPPVAVPAPEQRTVGALPIEPPPPRYAAKITPGGGIALTIGERTFPVESSFSFPNGGNNRLVCGDAASDGDPEWKVAADAAQQEIEGGGKFYAVARHVKPEQGRIVISDTITNRTAEPIGIIFHNRLGLGGSAAGKAYLAGKETATSVADQELKICPIVFLSDVRRTVSPPVSDDGLTVRRTDLGIGLVALDDVYIVQSCGSFDEKEGADLFSREFALDAGASYTLEWAIYVNATGDYYDLINAIRRDENRNRVTVEGGFAFFAGSQHKRDAARVPSTPQYYDIRNLKYATSACLSWSADDPGISIEGIDFVNYPIERQRIRAMMDALKSARPDVKGMFHVAHQLYATNRPDEHFPDSKVIGADGKQTVYTNDFNGYFSRSHFDDNWRWWIYYPTLDNSFGKAMLDSVDVMMDELGCRGVFADGFLWGYGGEYTYDRWDGHSADIDPKTQTIQRKKASVVLTTQNAMIAWCRKIWSKGGVVIANGIVPTRTICAAACPRLITDKEVTEGPDVPLLPTPCTLSNPAACRNDKEVYQDVLNKLRWGNLYFYYGEPETLAYESLPQQMYPITIREIHSGYVKGKERLITLHSGVYGWPEFRDLHLAYRYDARGHRINPGFVTTVDADSVRTRIELNDHESAVLVRIPVKIEASAPVNVIVEQYDGHNFVLTVNGKGPIQVITPGAPTRAIDLNGQQRIQIDMR